MLNSGSNFGSGISVFTPLDKTCHKTWDSMHVREQTGNIFVHLFHCDSGLNPVSFFTPLHPILVIATAPRHTFAHSEQLLGDSQRGCPLPFSSAEKLVGIQPSRKTNLRKIRVTVERTGKGRNASIVDYRKLWQPLTNKFLHSTSQGIR